MGKRCGDDNCADCYPEGEGRLTPAWPWWVSLGLVVLMFVLAGVVVAST